MVWFPFGFVYTHYISFHFISYKCEKRKSIYYIVSHILKFCIRTHINLEHNNKKKTCAGLYIKTTSMNFMPHIAPRRFLYRFECCCVFYCTCFKRKGINSLGSTTFDFWRRYVPVNINIIV